MFLPLFKCGSTFIHRNIHSLVPGLPCHLGPPETASALLRESSSQIRKPPAQAAFENVIRLPPNLNQFRGRYIP